MPFCKNCGKELSEGQVFCPECGQSQNDEVVVETEQPKVAKVWGVFAKLSKIFGIVAFILSFIPFLNIISWELGPVAIVFSILGKKDPTCTDLCKRGLVFGILGTVLGLVLYFVYFFAFALGTV